MSKYDFDNEIKELLNEEYKNPIAPPLSKEKNWESIQNKMNRPKKNNNKLKAVMAACIAATVISLSVFLPQGSASNWITSLITQTQGVHTHLFGNVGGSSDTPSTPPKVEQHNADISEKIVSLDEAKQLVNFDIAIPDYLPAEYHLQNVTVHLIENERSNSIVLNYISSRNEELTIEQVNGESGVAFYHGFNNENMELTELTINSLPATIIKLKDDSKKLYWISSDEIVFTIQGFLNEKELIRIVESI
ncbi:DUF4367 domain-containing protein [Evansella sp. AB-P1]|uniref:DUF4367 domain-containing protein n=1 Tax=Evansella sp. AB-P1 TaxID=3037653 RepID=UPI00241C5F8F|nr:DUF4367 domain-containing protein [Evansella sp. AB-P1]MDG5790164.1 DUF4367 domain-containing protein [Evansella sp. AB-P1]